MFWSSLLAATLLLQASSATPVRSSKGGKVLKGSMGPKVAVKNTQAFADATPLEISTNVLSLNSVNTTAKSSSALHNAIRASTGTTPLIPSDGGAGYNIDIEFGGKTFSVILDTGSSDLWLAASGFECVDPYMDPAPTADCAFGPFASSFFQGGAIANENFNISYGDGEFLTGRLGYESVSVGNTTVEKQEVALAEYGYWEGDNVTSGIMGFAYSSITSAFSGTNPAVDNVNTTAIPYTTWILNAINQGLAPMFSIAISRGSNGGGGQLALGGLPTVAFNHTFASTPLLITEITPHAAEAKNYSYYTINADGFFLSGQEETYHGEKAVHEDPNTIFPAIVDSGTTLCFLPESIADDVNALFDPPSVWNPEIGYYENYCDATAPTFAVRIDGTDFYISSEDMLLPASTDPDSDACLAGVQPGPGVNILGDVFLKNVIAVFDIGASEMRFAPREHY